MMEHIEAFQVIADPTRRRIVELLGRGERQVNDLVEQMDIHQSGVSRHLRILLDAGCVQVRPDGQRRHYALRPEPFQEMEAWLKSLHEIWDARLDRFGKAVDVKRRRSIRRTRSKERKT